MRILLLTHSFNSLSQRLFGLLRAQGHEVSVELDIADSVTEDAVALFRPDVVLAPFLKRRIPQSVCAHTVCLVVHPGVPGERVLIEEGVLKIDDAPLSEPALLAGMRFDATGDTGPYGRSRSKAYSVVPEDSFFVLSEAAENPVDSRSLGWVSRASVVGKVSAVWWPPSRWRGIRP